MQKPLDWKAVAEELAGLSKDAILAIWRYTNSCKPNSTPSDFEDRVERLGLSRTAAYGLLHALNTYGQARLFMGPNRLRAIPLLLGVTGAKYALNYFIFGKFNTYTDGDPLLQHEATESLIAIGEFIVDGPQERHEKGYQAPYIEPKQEVGTAGLSDLNDILRTFGDPVRHNDRSGVVNEEPRDYWSEAKKSRGLYPPP